MYFELFFNLALKFVAITLKFQKVMLEYYNSHSFSIADSNSGKEEEREGGRKEWRKEDKMIRKNSEI